MTRTSYFIKRIIFSVIPVFIIFLDLFYKFTDLFRIAWAKDPEPTVTTIIKYLHRFRGWLYYILRAKRQMQAMHNIYKDKRCFIISNGPSLNRTDLSHLKSEITFCMNSFFLKFDEIGFTPTYYVVMDNLVVEDRAREINQLPMNMIKFLPINRAYCLENQPNVVWINCPDMNGDWAVPSYSKSADTIIFHGSTITFITIQIAHYLGCNPIYLIGCDNSYKKPDTIKINDKGEWTSVEDDPNHFSPEYFGKGYRWHDPRTDLMARSYRIARAVLEEEGKELLNATIGGELEDLERVDYESLFHDAKSSS
jgi:hypothetical protein